MADLKAEAQIALIEAGNLISDFKPKRIATEADYNQVIAQRLKLLNLRKKIERMKWAFERQVQLEFGKSIELISTAENKMYKRLKAYGKENPTVWVPVKGEIE